MEIIEFYENKYISSLIDISSGQVSVITIVYIKKLPGNHPGNS